MRSLILCGALCACLLSACPARADSFSDGVSAYQAGNYARAATFMQNALKQNPHNAQAAFYLGLAYSHLNSFEPARDAFEAVIELSPPDSELAAKARNNVSYITKQQITLASNTGKAQQVMNASLSRNSKENYLTHVIPNGKIVHFSPAKMPLKVYIADGLGVPGWNYNMKQAVQFAMRSWQAASHGRVSFTQVYNEDNADIYVGWQRNFTDGILGVSPFQTAGDTIIRSDVNLAVYYPDSQKPIPMSELEGIAVHEFGHAIGIRGHSPYPDDIMFFAKTRQGNTLSARDVNTIGLLYQIDADVQNNTALSTALTKKYYALCQKGYDAQVGNRPADAINYYRQAMQISRELTDAKYNLAGLLTNEGNKLVRLNNLKAAQRNFQEATQLFGEVLQTPNAPVATKENLQIAKTNLALINGALNGR